MDFWQRKKARSVMLEEACCRFAFALYRAVTACYNGSIRLFLYRFVLP